MSQRTQTPITFTPCIVIHAGAGFHSAASEPGLHALLTEALSTAITILRSAPPNNTALLAVTTALRILEDSPLTNAGTGSNLTLSGTVECDASIMDGSGGSFGAVGAVPGLKNPIMGAAKVMEGDKKGVGLLGRVMPMVLCGEGARMFCAEEGVECVSADELVTEEAKKRWQKYMRYLDEAKGRQQSTSSISDRKRTLFGDTATSSPPSKRPRTSLPPDLQETLVNDTIGAVAMDSIGTIISAVSSGGIALKYPGRVGEAACFGAGVWAQNPIEVKSSQNIPQIGIGISVSGTGEQIMRMLAAKECAADLGDPRLGTTEVPTVLRKFVGDKVLREKLLDRYDERNVGFVVLRVEPHGGGGGGSDVSGEADQDASDASSSSSTETASCEVWYAHTTQSFSIGWMSARDRKPTVKMSRKRRGRELVMEGRPL